MFLDRATGTNSDRTLEFICTKWAKWAIILTSVRTSCQIMRITKWLESQQPAPKKSA